MMPAAPDLATLARRSRRTREAGLALLFASALLAGCYLLSGPARSHTAVAIAPEATSTPAMMSTPPIEARAAVVYDIAMHTVLYEKNDRAQLPLASLTKLLTVYAAVHELPQDATITIPEDVVGISEPHAFTPGQQFSLEELARLTLTGSLNDGATAIAEATAAYETHGVPQMLAGAAAALNLPETYALNGSGLDENTVISGGYGSALDVAKLAGALVEAAPQIAQATTQTATDGTDKGGDVFTIKNTDPMTSTIPSLLLSKTGYTDLAGGNLALVFDAGINHPIAVVVLGSTIDARFTDGVALVDATIAHFAGVSSL